MQACLLRYFFIFCVLSSTYFTPPCIAQSNITTAINTNAIKIGEPFTIALHGQLEHAILKNASLLFPDSLLHFDIIDSGKMKLQYNNNLITGFTQNIVLTSFDSGTWAIPSFNISLIETTSNTTKQLFSDTVPINVYYVKIDSNFILKDVKPIIEINGPQQNKPWMYIGFLFLTILLIIGWIVKKNKVKKISIPALSIYQTTMQQLQALALLDVNNATQLIQYHSALKQIFKTYVFTSVTAIQHNKTSTGILIAAKQLPLTSDLFTAVAYSVRMADAVQFAKYTPTANLSKQCLQNIQAAISYLHQQHT